MEIVNLVLCVLRKGSGDMTREEAIKIFNTVLLFGKCDCPKEEIEECLKMAIKALEQEPLTDKEQRIFLAAMGREEKVCREVDEKYPDKEPYEDSLMSVCRSIERKVKKALWE